MDRQAVARDVVAAANAAAAALTDDELAALTSPLDFIETVLPDWEVVTTNNSPTDPQYLLRHRTRGWWAVYLMTGADIRFSAADQHLRRLSLRLFDDSLLLDETMDAFVDTYAAACRDLGLGFAQWALDRIPSDLVGNARFLLAFSPNPTEHR